MDRIAREMEQGRAPSPRCDPRRGLGRRSAESVPAHHGNRADGVRTEDAIAVAVSAAGGDARRRRSSFAYTSSGFTAQEGSRPPAHGADLRVHAGAGDVPPVVIVWGVTPALIEHFTDYDKLLRRGTP